MFRLIGTSKNSCMAWISPRRPKKSLTRFSRRCNPQQTTKRCTHCQIIISAPSPSISQPPHPLFHPPPPPPTSHSSTPPSSPRWIGIPTPTVRNTTASYMSPAISGARSSRDLCRMRGSLLAGTSCVCRSVYQDIYVMLQRSERTDQGV